MQTPEQIARERIDRLLAETGWVLEDRDGFDRSAALGVAVREFPLPGGLCDSLLFVACRHRDRGKLGGAFCGDCRTIWEFTLPEGAEITALADSKGFETHEVMVELHGRCAGCSGRGEG